MTDIYELYNRKLLEEGAATRTLLVIAAGHPDPVRLAKEVLRSKVGVTEEVLDAPMWKVSKAVERCDHSVCHCGHLEQSHGSERCIKSCNCTGFQSTTPSDGAAERDVK